MIAPIVTPRLLLRRWRAADFARTAGLKKIYSFTAAINGPSQRVMQKIGMTKIGEFDHPSMAVGHRLCRHVLYSIDL